MTSIWVDYVCDMQRVQMPKFTCLVCCYAKNSWTQILLFPNKIKKIYHDGYEHMCETSLQGCDDVGFSP